MVLTGWIRYSNKNSKQFIFVNRDWSSGSTNSRLQVLCIEGSCQEFLDCLVVGSIWVILFNPNRWN